MIALTKVWRAAGDVAALLAGAPLEWFADRKPSERFAALVQVVIVVGCVVALLTACRPPVTAEVEATTVVTSGVVVRG